MPKIAAQIDNVMMINHNTPNCPSSIVLHFYFLGIILRLRVCPEYALRRKINI
jgi:hypothetical protein